MRYVGTTKMKKAPFTRSIHRLLLAIAGIDLRPESGDLRIRIRVVRAADDMQRLPARMHGRGHNIVGTSCKKRDAPHTFRLRVV